MMAWNDLSINEDGERSSGTVPAFPLWAEGGVCTLGTRCDPKIVCAVLPLSRVVREGICLGMLLQLSCAGAGHGCVLYLQSPNWCCLYEGEENLIPVGKDKFLDLSDLLRTAWFRYSLSASLLGLRSCLMQVLGMVLGFICGIWDVSLIFP